MCRSNSVASELMHTHAGVKHASKYPKGQKLNVKEKSILNSNIRALGPREVFLISRVDHFSLTNFHLILMCSIEHITALNKIKTDRLYKWFSYYYNTKSLAIFKSPHHSQYTDSYICEINTTQISLKPNNGYQSNVK